MKFFLITSLFCIFQFGFGLEANNETDKNRVRIVSPSFQLSSYNILNSTVAYLKQDYQSVTYSKYVAENGTLNVWRSSYAGTPQERALDLEDALFSDTNTSIVWTIRGGRNAANLFEFFPKTRNNDIKRLLFFVGFSDITAVHYFFSKYYPNIKTVHAAVANQIVSKPIENFQAIQDVVDGNPTKIVDLIPLNNYAKSIKTMKGSGVLGGNLALTQRSLKTMWEPNFSGKIAVLEEVGETPDDVAKVLEQIKLNRLLSRAKAIVFGQVYDTATPTTNSPPKMQLTQKDLNDLDMLANFYSQMNYFNITIKNSSDSQLKHLKQFPSFYFRDLELQIGVKKLPEKLRRNVTLLFHNDDEVTYLEAVLLHCYQSSYLRKGASVTILLTNTTRLSQQRTAKYNNHLDVLKDFAKKIDIPVFKSESFGHLDTNLPIPFNTPSLIYRNNNSCRNCKTNFTLEVQKMF